MTGKPTALDASRATGSTTSDALQALRALRAGGADVSVAAVEFGPHLAASLGPVLIALRWAAVMSGLGWAAAAAASGDLRVVVTLTVAVFLASWRTVRPIPLGERSYQRWAALADVVVLAAAAGFSAGLASPFIGCVLVGVAAAAFGWGLRHGALAVALAALTSIGVGIAVDTLSPAAAPLTVTALAAAAIFPGVARPRLIQAEARRREMAERMGRLSETNELLGALNQLARTLPSSLDLTDVLTAARSELEEHFEADRFAVLTVDDGKWSPLVQQGFTIGQDTPADRLPAPFAQAATARRTLRVDDLEAQGRDGSGLYARMIVNGQDAGLLVVESRSEHLYSDQHRERLDGTADMLALSISNARSFAHLRSLAAAEERTRIARDLHDRLGQWLTYIALEIERINGERDDHELKSLYEDTQGAIAELRGSLIELRAAVSADRPLGVVLGEVVDRFRSRSDLDVSLVVPDDRRLRLSAVVENELLRIAQEALTNVDKHADATAVHVGWSIKDGRGVLVISDDGRGFDPASGIRGTAYGLVGMRERAASVGSILEITSEPNQGTVITVLTSPSHEEPS